MSLKWRLSLSFVGITLLAMAVVGAILIPILARHYAGAEDTYLEAAAERAVRDLSGLAWTKDSPELEAAVTRLALLSQARVRVMDASGALLADSGVALEQHVATSSGVQPLPSPFGGGLFGESPSGSALPRSDATISRPVMNSGKRQGSVILSDAPDYAGAALRQAIEALGLAALIAVIVAGLAGWLLSSRLSSPLVALRKTSDRMARGDLTVRAAVDRRDEVGRLADSFNTMADEVERTVAMRQRFVADAAHEFGTPLTALQANLELAQARVQTAEARSLIDAAAAEARRLERLSSDLLRLSRLEGREVAQEQRPVDLAALVRHAADAVASRAEQKEIDLTLDLPDVEVRLPAYGDQLAMAFGNLVDNALKFTPRGGAVVLGLCKDERQAVLWVKDSGPGIPAEDLPKLFERFYRGRNAADQPGSGLGLAITRAVTELHGGSVGANSGPAGSRFELRLPLEPGPEDLLLDQPG